MMLFTWDAPSPARAPFLAVSATLYILLLAAGGQAQLSEHNLEHQSEYSNMPSFKSTFGIAAAQIALVAAGSPPSCPSNGQLSCQNTTAVANTCCFNAPGGQLLQTQFWDTNPSTGPTDSWTVHGLWPDHCDGTFDANCDASRAYTNITQILQAAGDTSTLSYMQTYWKDYQGNDESFWEHEWSKHGTCISTLNPSCYTNYSPQEEVVDFFDKTVSLFKTLNSYKFLSDAGIVPSSSKTYALSDIQAALKAPRGVDATVQCQNGAIDEIWYHFNVRGSVQSGDFVPADPDGTKGSCSSTVKYLPKTGSSGPTTTTPPGSGPTSSPGTPFSGKGYINVSQGGSTNGCLISSGKWYTTGTCATYTASPSGSGFTLTSSKGACGIGSDHGLVCGSGVSATVFTNNNGAVSGSWVAASVPSGSTQAEVYNDGSKSVAISLVWQGQ